METKLLVLGLFFGGMLIIALGIKFLSREAEDDNRSNILIAGTVLFFLWTFVGGLITFAYLVDKT